MEFVKKAIVVAVTMLVLDGVWLGLITPKFYYENLKHLSRGDGKIEVLYGPAAIVYVLMVLGFVVFLMPIIAKASWGEALLKSALLGLIVYGVYDFTNMATLRDWPVGLSLADMAWGAFLFAVTGAAAKLGFDSGFFAR